MEVDILRNTTIANPQTRDFLADAYIPKNNGKKPLVIFAHGYKGYKDWGAWDIMAQTFAEAGYFFVKFNFSHNGTTIEQPKDFSDLEAFANNNFTKELLDYQAVIDHFIKYDDIDSEKLILMGHSRGAGISVIQAFEDERVKALISFAGVSHFGYRFPSGDRLEDWKNSGVMYSENARTKQQMPHYYQFYENYKENEDRFSVQYAAQHLNKPFLIIQGTEDAAVKDKEAFLLNEWCSDSVLEIIGNANHTFGATEPWNSHELPNHLAEAIDKCLNFLQRNFSDDE